MSEAVFGTAGTLSEKRAAELTSMHGVPRSELEVRIHMLLLALRRVEKERDATNFALTLVQERSNAQLTENRNLRLVGTPEAIFLVEVLDEVTRARGIHGHLGSAPLFGALVEETGEVAKSLNEEESDENYRSELSQVAAVCVRLAVEGCSMFNRGPTQPKARVEPPP